MRLLAVGVALLVLGGWAAGAGFAATPAEEPAAVTHPLMPGIRAASLDDRDWPRALHDKLATGFSPLVCGMTSAPVAWAEVGVPGQLTWVRVLTDPAGAEQLLVSDAQLRLLDADGRELWQAPNYGALAYAGPLTGSARHYLLFDAGTSLRVVDAATGKSVWSHSFEPNYVALRVRVADILPERPGLEAAVFLNYGEEGALVSFPPDGEPQIVWQRRVVVPGEYNERYDHLCQIDLDLSVPEQPVIWSLRRYRARGFDARTGAQLSSVEYTIGGEQRRNYGPWGLGQSPDGARLGLVATEEVQLHVHGLRLRRDGSNELLWEHYYGEVYKETPGVAVACLGWADLDGDQGTDICYSVRDPEHEYRSFVRWRDGTTGRTLAELPDHWGAQLIRPAGPSEPPLILAYRAPGGAMPTQGELVLYALERGQPREVQKFANAQALAVESRTRNWAGFVGGTLLEPAAARAPAPTPARTTPQFFVREPSAAGAPTVNGYRYVEGAVERTVQLASPRLAAGAVRAVLTGPAGAPEFVVADADGLAILDEAGREIGAAAVHSSDVALVTAADLDRDGRAELLAASKAGGLNVYSFDDQGRAALRFNCPYLSKWCDRGPLCYDLDRDGKLEILTVAAADDGKLEIAPVALDGRALWRRRIDVYGDQLEACTLNAGEFLGPDHAAAAVSLTDTRRTHDGTSLLDGRTGDVLWSRSRYHDQGVTMPIIPRGVPTALDYDGDGAEELGMDVLSYMAFLRGDTGEFAFIRHTHNIRTDDAVGNGHLYNTYCPVFRAPDDARPHWMVTGGFGPFGMMGPDPRERLWSVDLDYDVPPNIAMIDVDGDGVLEVGYAAYNDRKFVCREAWSGKVEWTLELPGPPNGPVVSADFDGDGRGEFLAGYFCIGVDAAGQGVLRWQAPAAIGWGAVADFDGDGLGEIACPQAGRIVVLRRAAAAR